MLKDTVRLIVFLLAAGISVLDVRLQASDTGNFWNIRALFCWSPGINNSAPTRQIPLPPLMAQTNLQEIQFSTITIYLTLRENNPRYWANLINPQTQLLLKAVIKYVLLHRLLDYNSMTSYQEGYPAEAYPLDKALNNSFIDYIAHQPGTTPAQQILLAENSLDQEFANLPRVGIEEHIQNIQIEYNQRQNNDQEPAAHLNEYHSYYYNYAVFLLYMLNNLPKLSQALLDQQKRQHPRLNIREQARNLPTDGIFEALVLRVQLDLAIPAIREQAQINFQALLKKPENQLKPENGYEDTVL